MAPEKISEVVKWELLLGIGLYYGILAFNLSVTFWIGEAWWVVLFTSRSPQFFFLHCGEDGPIPELTSLEARAGLSPRRF